MDDPITVKRESVVTLRVCRSRVVALLPMNLYRSPFVVLTICPVLRLTLVVTGTSADVVTVYLGRDPV